MRLSTHLIAYNNQKYLPFCLKSLCEQTFQDFSVLIIDNGSQDGTVNLIEQYLTDPKNKIFAAKTKFIKNTKNLGFAGAHNQAIQWTKSDYVFMMNPDVILDFNYIKELVNFLDHNPDAAAAAGVIYKWDFTKVNQESLGKTEKIDSLGLKLISNHKVIELTDVIHQNKPQEVFGISGALPIYRRTALEVVKIPLFYSSFKFYENQTQPKLYEYFDNDFFCYKEDVDLAYRLRLFGFKAYMIPMACAWHDRTASAGASVVKNRKSKSHFINYHSYKNHLYFLLKNTPAKIWRRHFYQILPYEIFKLTYLLLLEQKTLSAFKEIIKNFPKMLKKRIYIQKKAGPNAWQNIEKWLKI